MKDTKKIESIKKETFRIFGALLGVTLYCLGTNLIVVPLNFYNGGLVGVSQVLRTLIERYTGMQFSFDIAGVLSYILNLPLFVLAYLRISKSFCFKTLLCMTYQTLLLTFVKAPAEPIITDPLTACLIAGILTGFGVGLELRCGASGGGTDLLGMYFVKYKPGYSVGKVTIIINAFIYVACALMYNLNIVIYSFIYAVISSFAVDKYHYQNINTEVMILTKTYDDRIQKDIMEKMVRGVTILNGEGAYTGDPTRVLLVIISKYEITQLKKIVFEYDPNAFVITKDNIDVTGNFLKHL